jgi:hypothetical protein
VLEVVDNKGDHLARRLQPAHHHGEPLPNLLLHDLAIHLPPLEEAVQHRLKHRHQFLGDVPLEDTEDAMHLGEAVAEGVERLDRLL